MTLTMFWTGGESFKMLEKITDSETVQKSVLLIGLGITAYKLVNYIIESYKDGENKEMNNKEQYKDGGGHGAW